MEVYYPPTGFYFKVEISGLGAQLDNSFQEVSGITAQLGTTEIGEGGENRFKYQLPTHTKYNNLVLKRGLVTKDSDLLTWCMNTIGSDLTNPIERKNIVVHLWNEEGNPLMSWNFTNAWPVQWQVSEFNAMNNQVVIEQLEFTYNYFNKV